MIRSSRVGDAEWLAWMHSNFFVQRELMAGLAT